MKRVKYFLLLLLLPGLCHPVGVGAEEGALNINNSVIYDNTEKKNTNTSSNPYLFLTQLEEKEKALQNEVVERHSNLGAYLFTDAIQKKEEADSKTISSYLFMDNYKFSSIETNEIDTGTTATEELWKWIVLISFLLLMLLAGGLLGQRFSKMLFVRRGE